MPLSLKLPRRAPDAPRLSLRDRLAALKGSAAKVMRRPSAGIARPKLPGAGTPSKALAAALAAHEMVYGYALYAGTYGLPDIAERRQAEEEAFRALLHTPLTSDADRAAYAAAVISRQMHSLGDGSATERDHPMAVAFRNIALSEHAREPEATRYIGRKAEPEAAADPIFAAIAAGKAATAAFDAFEDKLGEATPTPEQSAHESALCSADLGAQKAVWQTVPTTPAGRRALVEFARLRVARNTHPDGDVDDAGYLFGLVFDAFAAMVDADPTEAPASAAQAGPDVAALGILPQPEQAASTTAVHVDPHVALLPALRRAYAWDCAARPIGNIAAFGSPEEAVSGAVQRHCWDTAGRIIALPAPRTLAGLGALALALSVHAEEMIGTAECVDERRHGSPTCPRPRQRTLLR